MKHTLLALALFCGQVAWAAGYDFVTDPALCPLSMVDRHEKGMTFDGTDFWEIEFHCEIEAPLPMPDWTGFQTTIRAGYCEEPGFLYPTVFVFRTVADERGKLYVYEGPTGEPQLYHLCE